MKYQPVGHVEFANHLFDTDDLDPVYVGLYNLRLDVPQRCRWLMAYWCFYHVGVASQLSEYKEPQFWDLMLEHAIAPASKRGTERRHFRGLKVRESISWLREFGTVHLWIEYLIRTYNFSDISRRVQESPLFGPWIAFKVADMLERCLDIPVDFSDCHLEMYKEPVAGAKLVANPPETLEEVCTRLIDTHSHRTAPPKHDRPVGIQEIETVLCKYKSHYKGHYPLGKDSHEIQKSLQGWGSLAEEMAKVSPGYDL